MYRTVALSLLCCFALHAVDCSNAMSMKDMRECKYQELTLLEKELYQTYLTLMEDLDEIGQEKLTIAQASWTTYRDNEARFYSDTARGGSSADIRYTISKIKSTKKRIDKLKDTLKLLSER